MNRALFAVSVALAGSVWALPGYAQSNVALAETLYHEGRRLSEAGQYAQACPKFAESYRLDPATGTLLNLAACHEAEGKLASAWTEYQEALLAARRDQRPDRVQYAQERLAVVEPKLSWLTIDVPEASRVEGLVLTVDGVQIGEAAFGVATPINPGVHRVEARATGHVPWTREVTIGTEADRQALVVPALEAAPDPPPGAEAPMTGSQGTSFAPARDPQQEKLERPLPASFWVAAGLAGAATGVAVVSGVLYLDKKAEFDSVNNERHDLQTKTGAQDDASLLQTINTVAVVSAAASGVTAVVLYLTRPEAPVRGRLPAVTPWVTQDTAGLAATGRF